MKYFPLLTGLILALIWGSQAGMAQTNSAPDRAQATLDKHAKPVLTALKLEDAAKEAKVKAIVEQQFQILNAWHDTHDAQIKDLWNQFNQARSKMNQTNADAALAELGTVYATFQPKHTAFLKQLGEVLSPDQVEAVKDALTINKVKITYHAYNEIFHGLTTVQQAFILDHLKAAREEAIDAGPMTEKSAFFKKYKIQIEAYLTAQGYDVKKSYQEFVAKQKAEMAAKKTGSKPPEDKN